jgi:hypothetical protein
MIGRTEFNFETGVTRYFDENDNEIDSSEAAELLKNQNEGINDPV